MKPPEPQWYSLGYNDTDAFYLHGLERARVEEPVLHQLILGIKTATSIATNLGWPRTHVMNYLRDYKQRGMVYDEEGRRSIVWNLISGVDDDYDEIKAWALRQKSPGGLFNAEDRNEG